MPPGPASTGQNRGPPARGLNRSIQPLNVSTISQGPHKLMLNGGGPPRMTTMMNTTPLTSISSNINHSNINLSTKHRVGAREALTSLGLLCLGKLFFFNIIYENKFNVRFTCFAQKVLWGMQRTPTFL